MIRVIHGALDASEDCVGAFREDRIPDEPAAALRAMERSARDRAARRCRAARNAVDIPAPAVFQPTFQPALPAPTVPAAGLPAGGDGAAAGGESGPAGAFDRARFLPRVCGRPASAGNSTPWMAQIAEMAAECVRFRKASAAPLWRLASQPEYSSVIRHIGFVEQQVRSLAAQSRTGAAAATTQRLEHATFGRTTPAGRLERPHGARGGLV